MAPWSFWIKDIRYCTLLCTSNRAWLRGWLHRLLRVHACYRNYVDALVWYVRFFMNISYYHWCFGRGSLHVHWRVVVQACRRRCMHSLCEYRSLNRLAVITTHSYSYWIWMRCVRARTAAMNLISNKCDHGPLLSKLRDSLGMGQTVATEPNVA